MGLRLRELGAKIWGVRGSRGLRMRVSCQGLGFRGLGFRGLGI